MRKESFLWVLNQPFMYYLNLFRRKMDFQLTRTLYYCKIHLVLKKKAPWSSG